MAPFDIVWSFSVGITCQCGAPYHPIFSHIEVLVVLVTAMKNQGFFQDFDQGGRTEI